MSKLFFDVRSVDDLSEITGKAIEAPLWPLYQKLLKELPVRITNHLLPLIASSPAISAQFLPDLQELSSPLGEKCCFAGLLSTGVPGVERMYADRCVIMPHGACPAYCRFCFRKFHSHRRQGPRSLQALDRALAYVDGDARLQEVLLTGGEPILDIERLELLLDGLRRISHLGPIRLACRSLVTLPQAIDAELIRLLLKYNDLNRGCPLEIAAHVNHPDELSASTVDAILRLKHAGLHVYNQVVLLRKINSEAEVMRRLLLALRRLGVETYTIFFGEPVLGMDHLRCSMDEALQLKSTLRATLTGRANPHLILTTRIGKIELGVDGWIVERESDGRHVWLHTPYTWEGFHSIDEDFQLPEHARIDAQGFIEMRYLDGPSTCA